MRFQFRPALREQGTGFEVREPFRSRHVKQSGGLLFGQFPHGARREGNGNRRAKFIDEEFGDFALLPGAPHVFIEGAVARGGTARVQGETDDRVKRVLQDDLFGFNFGLRVNRQRICRISLGVVPFLSIESEIRREEEKRNVGREFREPRGGLDVYPVRERGIVLANGGFRNACTVQDQTRWPFSE